VIAQGLQEGSGIPRGPLRHIDQSRSDKPSQCASQSRTGGRSVNRKVTDTPPPPCCGQGRLVQEFLGVQRAPVGLHLLVNTHGPREKRERTRTSGPCPWWP
jgi:hypothetical protein